MGLKALPKRILFVHTHTRSAHVREIAAAAAAVASDLPRSEVVQRQLLHSRGQISSSKPEQDLQTGRRDDGSILFFEGLFDDGDVAEVSEAGASSLDQWHRTHLADIGIGLFLRLTVASDKVCKHLDGALLGSPWRVLASLALILACLHLGWLDDRLEEDGQEGFHPLMKDGWLTNSRRQAHLLISIVVVVRVNNKMSCGRSE